MTAEFTCTGKSYPSRKAARRAARYIRYGKAIHVFACGHWHVRIKRNTGRHVRE